MSHTTPSLTNEQSAAATANEEAILQQRIDAAIALLHDSGVTVDRYRAYLTARRNDELRETP